MIIYLAGKMRGVEGWNFAAFDMAAEKWAAQGHQVFSPAAMARSLGYGPGCRYNPWPTNQQGKEHLKHVMLSDIAALFAAEAIGLLPGWEDSVGTSVELALAQFLGLEVYDAFTMERMDPPKKPWSNLPRVTRTTCTLCEGKGDLLGCAGDRHNPPCHQCDGKGTVLAMKDVDLWRERIRAWEEVAGKNDSDGSATYSCS